ncbi:MAG: hypothetical protein RR033_05030 [Clostridia bacterium]
MTMELNTVENSVSSCERLITTCEQLMNSCDIAVFFRKFNRPYIICLQGRNCKLQNLSARTSKYKKRREQKC